MVHIMQEIHKFSGDSRYLRLSPKLSSHVASNVRQSSRKCDIRLDSTSNVDNRSRPSQLRLHTFDDRPQTFDGRLRTFEGRLSTFDCWLQALTFSIVASIKYILDACLKSVTTKIFEIKFHSLLHLGRQVC